MANSNPKIAICICTYDRYDVLPKAIESAVGQSLSRDDFEILVVDNSPDHDEAERYGAIFAGIPNLSYIVEETPGLSNARNVASRMTDAPIIAYLDDDAVASETWAAEILNAFETFGPKTSIVGGKVEPIWAAPRPPWLHDKLLESLSVIDWGGDNPRLAQPGEWFVGANISFRVEAIRRYGGFATNLGRKGPATTLMSNEESQLVDKIREAGELVVYAPRASVGHLVELKRLQPSWFRRRAAWQAVSDYMMDPAGKFAESSAHWPKIANYFNHVPPLQRTVRGLFFETDDPNLFNWQLGTIYLMTIAALAGFEGAERD